MEAANRGAFDAGAETIGLNIALPHEQYPNPYVTPELCFQFHYFALRKLHFMQRARALVAFPGGYGTLDELFEAADPGADRRDRPIPIILVGADYSAGRWISTFSVSEGRDRPADRALFSFAETAQDIFDALLTWERRRRLDRQRRPPMKLSFHGADRGVTGSCHLLEAAAAASWSIAGFTRAARDRRGERRVFGFDPRGIDSSCSPTRISTIAGALPLLVKRGFRGEIIATAATRELTRLVMLDSAHLQEEEARSIARDAPSDSAARAGRAPLYSILDAMDAFDRFGRNAAYGEADRARARPARDLLRRRPYPGLGQRSGSRPRRRARSGASCSPAISATPGGHCCAIPSIRRRRDVVVMETTYGDRAAQPLRRDRSRNSTRRSNGRFQRGGNVDHSDLRPGARAGTARIYLREGVEQQQAAALDAGLPEFADGDLGDGNFRAPSRMLRPEIAALLRRGQRSLLACRVCISRVRPSESIALNRIHRRRGHHGGVGHVHGRARAPPSAAQSLARTDCSVIFVGFAAKGTLARQIIDGARR